MTSTEASGHVPSFVMLDDRMPIHYRSIRSSGKGECGYAGLDSLLLELSEPLEVGEWLDIFFSVPTQNGRQVVQCQGEVSRVKASHGKLRYAATIRLPVIRQGKEALSQHLIAHGSKVSPSLSPSALPDLNEPGPSIQELDIDGPEFAIPDLEDPEQAVQDLDLDLDGPEPASPEIACRPPRTGSLGFQDVDSILAIFDDTPPVKAASPKPAPGSAPTDLRTGGIIGASGNTVRPMRQWKRLVIALKVRVTGEGYQGLGHSLDLSVAGMFIQLSTHRPPTGTWVWVEFEVPIETGPRSVRCVAEVLREVEPGEVAHAGNLPGIGVMFRQFARGFMDLRAYLMAKLGLDLLEVGKPALTKVPQEIWELDHTRKASPEPTKKSLKSNVPPRQVASKLVSTRSSSGRDIHVEILEAVVPEDAPSRAWYSAEDEEEPWKMQLRAIANKREPRKRRSRPKPKRSVLRTIRGAFGTLTGIRSVVAIGITFWLALLIGLAIYVVRTMSYVF